MNSGSGRSALKDITVSCLSQVAVYRRMRRFLRFRLGCHALPIAARRPNRVPRHEGVCTCCDSGALGDEVYLVFECSALADLHVEHAALFSPDITTMRGFFAQQDLYWGFQVYHAVLKFL